MVAASPTFFDIAGAPLSDTASPTLFDIAGAPLSNTASPTLFDVAGTPAPARHFGGITGDVVSASTPAQTFGGVSGGPVAIPPSRSYGGITGDEVLVGPLNVFGTVTGGSTVFTGVPPAAKLVAIPVATSTVSLTWIDVSDLEEGFRIERSPNGQGMWTEIGSVPADTEMFIDYTATPLVVFDYRVIAFNSVEDAAPSNVASAVTPAPGQPQPPGGGEPPKKVLDFLSPGVYGLERDDQNGDTGFRF